MADRSLEMGEKGDRRVGFLDLAAEMRNAIYELALTHDRARGRTASVALLRTCKQVYSEARDVLHAQANVQVDLSLQLEADYSRERSIRTCKIGGDLQGTIWGDAPLHELRIIWPACLGRVHGLTIWISIDVSAHFLRISSNNYAIINRVLYSLAVFLAENNVKGRTIAVDIKDTRINRLVYNTDPATLEKVFYPLANIPRTVNLQFGAYFNAIQQSLNNLRLDTIEETTLQFNAIAAMKGTVPDYEKELKRAIKDQKRSRHDTETPASQNIIRQSEALHETKRIVAEEYMSLGTERCLEACIEVMGNAVVRIKTERHYMKEERQEERIRLRDKTREEKRRKEQQIREKYEQEEEEEMNELMEMYGRDEDKLTCGNWGKQRQKMREIWKRQ